MNDTIFVTCIYNNLSRTKFGGRNHRNERYLSSIKILSNMDVPIICYTSSSDYDEVSGFLNNNNITNVTLKIKELSDIVYHTKIQTIKSESPEQYSDLFWSERCVELMFGKLIMINEIIDEYPNAENVYWIDAGLSHNDVIASPKYCSNTDMKANRRYRALSLFNPRLVKKINEYLDGNILLMEATLPHNNPIPQKYNKNPYINHHGAVGGLFGGNSQKMKLVCKSFFEKVDAILNDNLLYGEENILFAVYVDNPQLFKTFQFETWYHEGWGAEWNNGHDWFMPEKINFSNFFDVVLENEIINDKISFVTMAYGEKYRNLSLDFIASFEKYCNGIELIIVTDDKNFYQNTSDKIKIVEHDIKYKEGLFPYSMKHKAIELARNETYGCKYLLYLDADCFFIKEIKSEYFYNTVPGLNVVLGTNVEHITNAAVKNKVNSLIVNEDEKNINVFRECALLFNIENNYNFNKFLIEWSDIHDFSVKQKLTHVAECTDIFIAAKRANLPINDLKIRDLYDLRECIFTTVLNEPVRAIL